MYSSKKRRFSNVILWGMQVFAKTDMSWLKESGHQDRRLRISKLACAIALRICPDTNSQIADRGAVHMAL